MPDELYPEIYPQPGEPGFRPEGFDIVYPGGGQAPYYPNELKPQPPLIVQLAPGQTTPITTVQTLSSPVTAETTKIRGEMVKPTAEQQQAYYELTGQLAPLAYFVPNSEGEEYIVPKDIESQVKDAKNWWDSLVPAYEKAKPQIAETRAFEVELKKSEPELYEIYKKRGVEAYNKELEARQTTEYETKQRAFDASHIRLRDSKGEDTWVPVNSTKDKEGNIIQLGWNDWPSKYQSIASRENIDEAIQAVNADIDKVNSLEKDGYIKDNSIDITAFLRDKPKDVQTLRDLGVDDKIIQQVQEQLVPPKVWTNIRTNEKITSEEYQALGDSIKRDEYVRSLSPATKEILIEVTPIIGTIHYVQKAKEGGLTSGEIWGITWRSAIDVATIAFGIGAMAAGARATKGVGVMARLSGAAKGAGEFVVAEVKAPYTMIRHPIETAKTIYHPFETLLHPKVVPLAAVETSFTTIRIPVRATGNDAVTARKLRDAVTDASIYGREAKATVNGVTVRLSPTALEKVGVPVAVHTTPDVRPFVEGATIRAGREGGLYIAPNVHTRFSYASAFGDLPEGGVKGALIFRDEKLMKAIAPSDKLFRRTAEIEAVMPSGTKLPKPSQTIFTRDMSGNKLVLLVFGKPFTPIQVAKLKFFGTIDTLSQIFEPAIKISRSERGAVKALDEMIDLTKERARLEKQIETYRKAGETRKLVQAERSMTRLTGRIDNLRPRIERGLSARAITRASVAWAQFTDRGLLERWNDSTVGRSSITREGRIIAKRLPSIDTRRISEVERPILPTRGEITTPRIPPRILTRVPPERPPERPPTRVPPERPPTRVPPERPPIEPPPRRPPIRPPKKPPVIPPTRPPTMTQVRETKVGRRSYEGAVAWQQGGLLRKGKLTPVWKVWSRPYRQEDLETLFENELPIGVKTVSGVKSAYETVQQFRGKVAPSETQEARVGAFVATVHQPTAKPGGAGEIKFSRDIRSEKTGAWERLSLHTTIEQLIEIAFRSSTSDIARLSDTKLGSLGLEKAIEESPSARVNFAKKALADKISNITPAEVANVITKTKLNSGEKRELLRMMPDRERQQVNMILSEPELYAPTRGTPKAQHLPSKLRRRKIKTKKAKAKPTLIGARL